MTTLTLAEIRDGTGFPADVKFAQVTDYNGWTNYATWGVALVLDNEESDYRFVRDVLVRRAREAAVECERPAHVAGYLADYLREYVDEMIDPEETDYSALNSMQRQIMQAGMCEVDWDEIAANVLSEES